jgi:hypothetical protein
VRFSEEDATNSTSDISELLLSDRGHPEIPTALEPDLRRPATTPWIALVACDANATHASQDTDIFTLANDRGAVGAVRISPMQALGRSFIIPSLAPLLGMVKRLYY